MNTTMSTEMSSTKLVPAVVRAVEVLDEIARFGGGVKLSELVYRTGFPKSSLHGICQTLVQLGLLKHAADGSYVMGPRSVRWADVFLASADILDAFHDALAQKEELSAYTLTLSRLEGAEVIYLGCRNSSAPLGISFRRGMRVPAIFTATGKAMMAAMSPEERIAHLPSSWPEPLTPTSVRSLKALEAEFRQVGISGFSLDNGQLRDGMFCIGAAICDSQSRPVAGIAISMTEVEAKPAIIEQAGVQVRGLAEAVSEKMGWGV